MKITEDKLKVLGFVPGRMPGDLVLGPIVMYFVNNVQSPAHGQTRWAVRTWPIPESAKPQTMEDVEVLIKALGANIKE